MDDSAVRRRSPGWEGVIPAPRLALLGPRALGLAAQGAGSGLPPPISPRGTQHLPSRSPSSSGQEQGPCPAALCPPILRVPVWVSPDRQGRQCGRKPLWEQPAQGSLQLGSTEASPAGQEVGTGKSGCSGGGEQEAQGPSLGFNLTPPPPWLAGAPLGLWTHWAPFHGRPAPTLAR